MDDRDTERSVRKNEIVKGELSNGWLKVELNEASDHDWQSGWDFATASLKKSVARPASLRAGGEVEEGQGRGSGRVHVEEVPFVAVAVLVRVC